MGANLQLPPQLRRAPGVVPRQRGQHSQLARLMERRQWQPLLLSRRHRRQRQEDRDHGAQRQQPKLRLHARAEMEHHRRVRTHRRGQLPEAAPPLGGLLRHVGASLQRAQHVRGTGRHILQRVVGEPRERLHLCLAEPQLQPPLRDQPQRCHDDGNGGQHV